jgi:hypothetical protein
MALHLWDDERYAASGGEHVAAVGPEPGGELVQRHLLGAGCERPLPKLSPREIRPGERMGEIGSRE